MFSIGARALSKLDAHLQQRAANRVFVWMVMAMSLSCLMTTARAETAPAAVPHNGRIPAGFHHRRPHLLRGCSGAHSCEPVVAFRGFERRERGNSRCAAQGVDGDARALADDRHVRNVIVTGANRGLGFAIADHMLDVGGYRVVLACRSQQEVR